jgi:N-acetylneuraminic acid mutarotase
LLAGLIVSAVPVSAGTLYWAKESVPSVVNKVLEADDINDIALASDDNTVYAVLNTAGGKLYKSANLGATWTAITLPATFPGGGTTDLVAVAPDNADISHS